MIVAIQLFPFDEILSIIASSRRKAGARRSLCQYNNEIASSLRSSR